MRERNGEQILQLQSRSLYQEKTEQQEERVVEMEALEWEQMGLS